jgi:inosine-uridine nucleoside N-ribohydrolase
MFVAACGAGAADDRSQESTPDVRIAVVLDYSPTISDVGALLFLASDPLVDLLAVTMPGTGEADCAAGAGATRTVLAALDRSKVPVGCGVAEPVGEGHPWPAAFRDAANSLADRLGPQIPGDAADDAVALLARTLRDAGRPVTLVAVAPLTNVASLLAAEPGAAGSIARMVVMAGAVDVPGNVDPEPTAEWNAYVDPAALRQVLAAGLPVDLVPLDATNDVPWSSDTVDAVEAMNTTAGALEHQVLSTAETLEGWSMWDELAAVVAVHPEVVSREERTLSVDHVGATRDDDRGDRVRVATSADRDDFITRWLEALDNP